MSHPVRNVDGLAAEGIKPSDKHPVWFPPKEAANGNPLADNQPKLMVANSLTETVEPFVSRNGRHVKWYTCGPTVYDMSHMGHARAYLTFDIIRRIMEDYFGYSIEYQMNITDVDDKIIKRARVNKLVADYTAEFGGKADKVAKVNADIAEAARLSMASLVAKKEKLELPMKDDATTNEKKDREEKKAENKLKITQLEELMPKIKAAQDANKTDATETIQVASSILGEMLDDQKGADIRDQAIFEAHARRYEKEFFDDCETLNIRPPDVISRVTEVVPEIVDYIKQIMDNGFAYKGESSIFFDTGAFMERGHNYPKLKPVADEMRKRAAIATEEEMAEGEGTLSKAGENERKSPNDFALWKFAKPGEPTWYSPWGEGRPGWHIECSVMASGVLGDNMDIHAGGFDLKFPHHDNEMAQAEAYWGHHQWVNYFWHCGRLDIDGLKMSKSLKNFITIRQALEDERFLITPRQMRLVFLANRWEAPMDFSDQNVAQAREFERQLRSFFGEIERILRDATLKETQGFNKHDKELKEAWLKAEQQVHVAFCSNFDTAAALDAIRSLMKASNIYFADAENTERRSATLLRKIGRFVTRIFQVLGVVPATDGIGLGDGGAATSDDQKKTKVVCDAITKFRDEVRRVAREGESPKSLLPMCDAIRDEWLPPAGIRLEDKPNAPTIWKKDDPKVLMREVEERRAEKERGRVAALEKAKAKLKNKIETQKKLLAKFEKLADPPAKFFLTGDRAAKYKHVDPSSNLPTQAADGAVIDEKGQKKLQKELDAYKKGHEEFQQKGGEKFLQGVRDEIAGYEAELAGEGSNNNDDQ